MSDELPLYRPRCRYINCKSMLVYGEDFVNDPEFQMGMVDFWCVQTAKGQGPDDGLVSLELCSDPERGCYQEY